MEIMASLRELIAKNIESVLNTSKDQNLSNYRINKVVRDPVVIEDLSRTSLPLIFVESADETREDISMGGSAVTRQGTIEFNLNLYLQGESRDTQRNGLIQTVEDVLELDRTRGGNALDTQVTQVELIDIGEAAPYASIRIVVECTYCYTRGAS
jgi:hypothetical protein